MRWPLALLLVSAACAEETARPPASGLDASSASDGGASRDAAASDAAASDGGSSDAGGRDAAPGLDVAPDDGLDGTTLAPIRSVWSEALTLCSAWREGRSLADELRDRAELRLPPQARGGLTRAELSAIRIEGGSVLVGPFAADARAIDAGASLREHRLSRLGDSDALYAAVSHEGAAGTVSEELSVTRARGDTRPVSYDDGDEVTFAFQGAGGGEDAWTRLEPCEGPWPRVYEAAEVIVGSGGGRSVALLRTFATFDAAAGSAPHHPIAAAIYAAPGVEAQLARGHWAQTYSAQHHNWAEHSLYDLRLDLVAHALYFGPFDRGARLTGLSRVERLELEGLSVGGADGTMRVTELDLGTGRASTSALVVPAGPPRRVDTTQLLRELSCAGAEVIGVGDLLAGRFFQLLACPGAGPLGFRLEAIVPAIFAEVPALSGVRVEARALTPERRDGRDGLRASLGDASVFIARLDADNFILELSDGSGAPVYAGLAPRSELRLPAPEDERLHGLSASGDVELTLVRRYGAWGVGESRLYAPVSFELRWGGERRRVEAWDRLVYTNTHHNWNDDLVATTDALELAYHVRFDGGGLRHTVEVKERATGAVILAPTELTIGP